MLSKRRNNILLMLGSLLLSCTDAPTKSVARQEPLEDVIEQEINRFNNSSILLSQATSPYHTLPPHLLTTYPFPDAGIMLSTVAERSDEVSTADSASEDEVGNSEDSTSTTDSDKIEKWVKVGDDHHQKWCPQETPIYLAGKCVTLDQTSCLDSDDTEALFKKSEFGDYFEETIATSDPSLGLGGTVTFSLLSEKKNGNEPGKQDTKQETFPDACKGTFILEEYYCSDGLPTVTGIKCNDYLPESECVVDELGQGFCQQKDVCLTVPGIQVEFIFDTDDDGITDSCIPDLCPTVAGVQGEFSHDNNADGTAESCFADKCPDTMVIDDDFPFYYNGVGSCIEDLCPETPEIDILYLFYYNGIGSCIEDKCLNLEGIQEHLPYDTDFDDWGDSCIPDLCSNLTGVQFPFPFDNDNDGNPESCIKDVCPENLMVGPQDAFPYDVDGDGVNESCVPVDEFFCEEPDPIGKYPEGTLYSYDEHWHAGFCIDSEEDSILHVICSEDGTWHTDVTECEMGMPCVNGACAECYDSDGTYNYDEKGYVINLEKDGTVDSNNDACINALEIDYRLDYICKDNAWVSSYQACPIGELCIEDIVNGKSVLYCIPGVPMSCEDSDGTDNFTNVGYVKYTTKEGQEGIAHDGCVETDTVDALLDRVCINDIPNWHYKWCEPNEICEEKTEYEPGAEGVVAKSTIHCVPNQIIPTCEDSDGTENYAVKGKITGINKHGKEFSYPDDCINASYFNAMIDYVCNENDTGQAKYNYCKDNEFCKEFDENSDGILDLLKCVPACIDTDPDENPSQQGTVYDFNNVPYSDVCEGNVLYQYACDSLTGEKVEAGMTNCANGCDQGKCKY